MLPGRNGIHSNASLLAGYLNLKDTKEAKQLERPTSHRGLHGKVQIVQIASIQSSSRGNGFVTNVTNVTNVPFPTVVSPLNEGPYADEPKIKTFLENDVLCGYEAFFGSCKLKAALQSVCLSGSFFEDKSPRLMCGLVVEGFSRLIRQVHFSLRHRSETPAAENATKTTAAIARDFVTDKDAEKGKEFQLTGQADSGSEWEPTSDSDSDSDTDGAVDQHDMAPEDVEKKEHAIWQSDYTSLAVLPNKKL
ncbi:uncharacterized protein IWZ02DRAFT_431100 [Phyllosticta citriasiana]|uniref:uncharacterized protein n=1 Tax=Phyllosticta citriasiana TaxID=595635 RepID=UPI0030FD6D50